MRGDFWLTSPDPFSLSRSISLARVSYSLIVILYLKVRSNYDYIHCIYISVNEYFGMITVPSTVCLFYSSNQGSYYNIMYCIRSKITTQKKV